MNDAFLFPGHLAKIFLVLKEERDSFVHQSGSKANPSVIQVL